jgi:hypothetical protein
VINFSTYIRALLRMVFSSSVCLGLLAAAIILIVGETSISLDITLDIKRSDSVWVLLGLPIIAIILFAILSPISFLIYKLISRLAPILAVDSHRPTIG